MNNRYPFWKHDLPLIIRWTSHWMRYGFIVFCSTLAAVSAVRGISERSRERAYDLLEKKIASEIRQEAGNPPVSGIQWSFVRCANEQCVRAFIMEVPSPDKCGQVVMERGGPELQNPAITQEKLQKIRG